VKTVSSDELRALTARIFHARGVSERDSGIIADSLVHANLRGVDSHGVMRVAHYVRRLELGSINPKPDTGITRTGPATAMVDGDNGFGHVTNWDAMELAINMARETGVGLVGVQHSNHCGALSFFAYRAIEANMAGLVLTQTDKGVVPVGGRKPFCGSNPLCLAAPSASGMPIVLDMATSTVAGGHVYKARAENRSIPSTWAVDEEGQPATDPHKAVYWTPAAGAKGYGLGVMNDVLTGILCGGDFGPHILPMYDQIEKTRNLCHLVGALDIGRFAGASTFLPQAAAMINELHQAPTMSGVEQVLVPGEPEHLKTIERTRTGIPLTDQVWEELQSLAAPGKSGD